MLYEWRLEMRRYGLAASLAFFVASSAVRLGLVSFLFWFIPDYGRPPPGAIGPSYKHVWYALALSPAAYLLVLSALVFAVFGVGLFARKWPSDWWAVSRSGGMAGAVVGVLIGAFPNLGFLRSLGVSVDFAAIVGYPLLGLIAWWLALGLARRGFSVPVGAS
jgi:hypothetical protein